MSSAADMATIVELYQVLYEADGRLRDPALNTGSRSNAICEILHIP